MNKFVVKIDLAGIDSITLHVDFVETATHLLYIVLHDHCYDILDCCNKT